MNFQENLFGSISWYQWCNSDNPKCGWSNPNVVAVYRVHNHHTSSLQSTTTTLLPYEVHNHRTSPLQTPHLSIFVPFQLIVAVFQLFQYSSISVVPGPVFQCSSCCSMHCSSIPTVPIVPCSVPVVPVVPACVPVFQLHVPALPVVSIVPVVPCSVPVVPCSVPVFHLFHAVFQLFHAMFQCSSVAVVGLLPCGMCAYGYQVCKNPTRSAAPQGLEAPNILKKHIRWLFMPVILEHVGSFKTKRITARLLVYCRAVSMTATSTTGSGDTGGGCSQHQPSCIPPNSWQFFHWNCCKG